MSEIAGSPESQERARDFNVRQRETRANYHNELDRSLLKKVLGKGKISEADIAGSEAIFMDEKIDELIASGEAIDRSEAVNILNRNETTAQDRGVLNPSPQNDGGKSMRYAGNFRVDGKSETPEEGEK